MKLSNYELSSDDFLENNYDSETNYENEPKPSEAKRRIRELIDLQIERKRLQRELDDDFNWEEDVFDWKK